MIKNHPHMVRVHHPRAARGEISRPDDRERPVFIMQNILKAIMAVAFVLLTATQAAANSPDGPWTTPATAQDEPTYTPTAAPSVNHGGGRSQACTYTTVYSGIYPTTVKTNCVKSWSSGGLWRYEAVRQRYMMAAR